MVELTDLERMVVLNNTVLRRNLRLLPHRKLQLQLQPLTRLHLLLMQLQVRRPVCRHILLNSGILQLNIQVERQVRTITLLRAVQTSVKKITELVNRDLFSNPNVSVLQFGNLLHGSLYCPEVSTGANLELDQIGRAHV